MIQSADQRRKTILFFRSSTLDHCLRVVTRLKQTRHPESETRWVCILQPQVEKAVVEEMNGSDPLVLTYDGNSFTHDRLNRLFADRLKQEQIDTVYIPFNNPEGRGYWDILRFSAGLKPRKIVGCTPRGDFERLTLWRFGIRRTLGAFLKSWEAIGLAAALPCIALYYLFQSFWIWTRRRRSLPLVQAGRPARLLSRPGIREGLELIARRWQLRYFRKHDISEFAENILGKLKQDGIVILPDFLPPDIVLEMKQVTDTAIGQGRYRYGDGKIASDSPPVNIDHIARLNVLDVTLYSRRFIEFALNDLIVSVANAHLGLDSFISGIVAYRTQPVAAAPSGAFLWHYDNTPLQLKAICYLTEVSEEDGPLVYVKSTHHRRVQALHYEETRIDEKDVPLEGRIVCVGKPGTVILIDTNGIHRAAPNKRRFRDVVSAIYDAGTAGRQACFYNLPIPSQDLRGLRPDQRRMLRLPEHAG